MQAVVLHAVGDIRFEEIPVPSPGSGDVRVRVGFCGVCGSDIPRIFSKGTYSFPTVCGHEFAGTVEECGTGVTRVEVGDRVAVFPLLWCGRCSACEQGKYVHCSDYDYLGSRRDGAFAEFVVAPERNLLPVPDNVTLEEAAMVEPAAVSLHALRRAGGCSAGDSVAVFGMGPIGLMVAQWARVMGAGRILLFDVMQEKIELANHLGFDQAYDSRAQDPAEVIEHCTGGRGVDVSVEAVGLPQTLVKALSAAGRNGRVVLLGNPSSDVTIPAALLSRLMRREVSVLGTWNSDYSALGNRDDWGEVLSAVSARRIDLKSLISHRVPLTGAIEALNMMRDRSEFYTKVLIRI